MRQYVEGIHTQEDDRERTEMLNDTWSHRKRSRPSSVRITYHQSSYELLIIYLSGSAEGAHLSRTK